MSWTKRELLTASFGEIGLASYVFALTPEQWASALRKMDSMLGTWNGQGIRLGYPLPSSPSSSQLDGDSNLPDSAIETVYSSVAVRIAPDYGKTPSLDTRLSAYNGYNALLVQYQQAPPEMQFPSTLPAGAGNKQYNRGNSPFLNQPVDELSTGQDGDLEF